MFFLVGDSWWELGVAVFLAVVFGQIGFLGHDAGHGQVFATRRANYVLGVLCGNLGTGLSYGWWTGKHIRHHAHPNTEGTDPDVMIGPLAFSGARAQPLVAAFCAERGLPYCQATLLGSYAQALRHLNEVGKLTRSGTTRPGPCPVLTGPGPAAHL